MTQLVEDITIKITLNHCEGDSTVLGGPNNLRETVVEMLAESLPRWIAERHTDTGGIHAGINIGFTNTGLYEAPEIGGGDN
jgi:hypothetical protein